MMCVVLNVFACFFCYEHKINPLGYLSFVKVSDFFFFIAEEAAQGQNKY